MKTSVIEIHDMLSVLSVDGVEKRIGEVPGVMSVTVNHAAGNATVRYDETRLEIADIKSAVRQIGYEPADEAVPKEAGEQLPAPVADTPKAAPVAPAPAAPAADANKGQAPPSAPVAAEPEPPAAASAGTPTPAPATPPVHDHKVHEEPGALGKVAAWVRNTFTGEDKGQSEPGPQTSAPAAAEPKAAPTAPAGKGHEGHSASGAQPAMSADMAHEMGHSGKDLPAMVRDMRNRFWICLVFTVPIFVYAPMGGIFEPPAPPFGLELNLWLFFFASAAVLYPSWPFFVSAWRALMKGVLGMAALIVLSVGTGYLFSVGTTFFYKESGQFFEAVAVLLVFILLGHWLEMRARAGASSAIKALMNLTPAMASVIRNGAETEVPTAEVLAGEIVVMRRRSVPRPR